MKNISRQFDPTRLAQQGVYKLGDVLKYLEKLSGKSQKKDTTSRWIKQGNKGKTRAEGKE